MNLNTDQADIRMQAWDTMRNAAIDWQYLIVQAGGMARKSDCDEWLMQRYGIDNVTARNITNAITDGPVYFYAGRDGLEWRRGTAGRPAPDPADYPDIDYGVGR